MIDINDTQIRCNYKVFRHQAAGHQFHDGKQSFIVEDDDHVYKLTGNDPRQKREEWFYKHISTSKDPVMTSFRTFVPIYFGTFDISFEKCSSKYLKLENINSGFNFPCILDVKLGRVSYDPFASEGKIASQSGKYSYQREVGFRFDGSQIYDKKTEQFIRRKRDSFKHTHPNEIANTLADFLVLDHHPQRQCFAKYFLKTLCSMKKWFEGQKSYQFFGSSLLFCYDAYPSLVPDGKIHNEACRLKLIDFGHTYLDLDSVTDENCLSGINTLISSWTEIC